MKTFFVITAAMAITAAPSGTVYAAPQSDIARYSFSDVAWQYPQDQRETADRMMVEAAIPQGTSIGQARATLLRKGASCKSLRSDEALTCRYTTYHIVDDSMQNVRVDIKVTNAAGLVTRIDLQRSIYSA